MPRKPRLRLPGGLYHVILRGNDRQDIFFEDEDRLAFYRLLEEGTRRFDYRVHAFCLMTNHVHLALQMGPQPLSKGLQNLCVRGAWIWTTSWPTCARAADLQNASSRRPVRIERPHRLAL
jgi:REP element-mobilizing transposase RayT